MQNNIAAGCIKGFLIICKPKTKETKFAETLGLYILKTKTKKIQKYKALKII